jgi:hypothetical protein
METQKHTKGEWIYSKYQPYDFGVHSTEGRGNDIALVRGSDEEAEANAKLIAAAPELLASLIEIFDLLEINEPEWYLRKHFNHAINAIRKATL